MMIVLGNITRIYKIGIIFATLFVFSMIVSLVILDYKMVLSTRMKNDTTGQQVDKKTNGLVREHNVYLVRIFYLHVTMLEFNHKNKEAIFHQLNINIFI
jgi:hypothetical protein